MRWYHFGFFTGPRYPKAQRTLVEEWGCFSKDCRSAKQRAADYLYLRGLRNCWPAFLRISSDTDIEKGLNAVGKLYLNGNPNEGAQA